MTKIELQRWLGTRGQPVVTDGAIGPKTREAIIAAFTNDCAPAVTETEIRALSDRMGCTPKQLRAVAQVESGGGGYDNRGRPKILFERHLFHRFTNGVHSPAIFSSPRGGGYDISSWEKLTLAAAQDVDAAFASVSWGKFQVLGAHASGAYSGFLNLGYANPLELAYSTVTGEGAHYELLARYIEKAGLKRAIQQLSTNPTDNIAFAKGYNGPAYKKFAYDTKLAKAMA
jgi:N-acetylmuramidase/Predicted Peptidoglycan domain